MSVIRLEVMENEKPEEWYAKDWVTDPNSDRFLPIYNAGLKMLDDISREKNKKPLTVLEAGCGDGHFGSLVLRKHNYQGFDFCSYVVGVAKQRRLNVWRGNVYDAENYDFKYDVFVAMEVLEHVDDLRVLDHVRTGAGVICSMPLNEPIIPGEATGHVRWYKSEAYIRERFADRLIIDEFVKVTSERQNTSIMFRGLKL